MESSLHCGLIPNLGELWERLPRNVPRQTQIEKPGPFWAKLQKREKETLSIWTLCPCREASKSQVHKLAWKEKALAKKQDLHELPFLFARNVYLF